MTSCPIVLASNPHGEADGLRQEAAGTPRPPVIYTSTLKPADASVDESSIRRLKGFFWAGLVLIGICAAVLYAFNPAQHSFYPYCVLYRSTGLLCAGCGSLRASHSLLHGDLRTAFALNPLFVLALPLLLVPVVRWILRAAGYSSPVTTRPWWIWIGAAILVLYTVARNVPRFL